MSFVAKESPTRPEEAGHWYTREGKPAYEVPGKDGTMRPTTLRDARKLGLVPSVSGIIRCAASPGLERWKAEQLMMSALTLPRDPEETEVQWLERVRVDSQEQGRKAKERGTAIHASIEKHLLGESPPEEHWPYVRGVQAALSNIGDGWVPEASFAHPYGFGGKLDMHAPGIVGDVKTKEFGEDKDADDLAYDEHCMQLAAYARGMRMDLDKVVTFNVFVSTNNPGLVRVKHWKPEELMRGMTMFASLLNYWQAKNRYDSSFSPV